MTIPDRLSVEDINHLITLEIISAERKVLQQLLDTMRDNERLREALSFYADWPNNYKPKEFEMNSAIKNDSGKKAREALSNKDSDNA